MPTLKRSSGMTKSIDLRSISLRSEIFLIRDTYIDNGWYAMDIEKIVSPEDTGNLVRVESLSNGGHK